MAFKQQVRFFEPVLKNILGKQRILMWSFILCLLTTEMIHVVNVLVYQVNRGNSLAYLRANEFPKISDWGFCVARWFKEIPLLVSEVMNSAWITKRGSRVALELMNLYRWIDNWDGWFAKWITNSLAGFEFLVDFDELGIEVSPLLGESWNSPAVVWISTSAASSGI